MPADGRRLHGRRPASFEDVHRRPGANVVATDQDPSTQHQHAADPAHQVPPRPLDERNTTVLTILQQMIQNIYIALITTARYPATCLKPWLQECQDHHAPWHCNNNYKPLHNSKVKKLFRTLVNAAKQADVINEENRSSRPCAPPPQASPLVNINMSPSDAHVSSSDAHYSSSVAHAQHALAAECALAGEHAPAVDYVQKTDGAHGVKRAPQGDRNLSTNTSSTLAASLPWAQAPVPPATLAASLPRAQAPVPPATLAASLPQAQAPATPASLAASPLRAQAPATPASLAVSPPRALPPASLKASLPQVQARALSRHARLCPCLCQEWRHLSLGHRIRIRRTGW